VSEPLLLAHTAPSLYRVVRRGWKNPLDPSFSQKTTDNRWNTPAFPALYCACSPNVARAITLDLFRFAGLMLEDLQPPYRPQLIEISWNGDVVDAATDTGLERIPLPGDPLAVSRESSQQCATAWHTARKEGVACRSASLARLRFTDWTGSYLRWGEIALFTDHCRMAPRLKKRIRGLEWMLV
jgi:hypothetical protein